MNEIEVKYLDSEEDIQHETMAMLGMTPKVTVGMVVKLHLANSPFIHGGKATEADIRTAVEITGIAPDELEEELTQAWKIWRIAVQETDRNVTDDYGEFSPEWLADIIASACAACPSMTPDAVLWKEPLALILHLVMAGYRRNGGHTERPIDIEDALAKAQEAR